MDNIYEAPKSELANDEATNISEFKRFTTWGVIGLTIITLSLYIPYWLTTRTSVLNRISDSRTISMGFVYTVLVIYVGSFPFSIWLEFYPNENLLIASALLDLVANILIIVWCFMFRACLMSAMPSSIRIGPVLTFFFQIYYLQYKINEAIDISVDVSQR